MNKRQKKKLKKKCDKLTADLRKAISEYLQEMENIAVKMFIEGSKTND